MKDFLEDVNAKIRPEECKYCLQNSSLSQSVIYFYVPKGFNKCYVSRTLDNPLLVYAFLSPSKKNPTLFCTYNSNIYLVPFCTYNLDNLINNNSKQKYGFP